MWSHTRKTKRASFGAPSSYCLSSCQFPDFGFNLKRHLKRDFKNSNKMLQFLFLLQDDDGEACLDNF